MQVSINKSGIIPPKNVWMSAIATGLTATVTVFLIDFLGLRGFFDFIPKAWNLFAIVFASVYLANLIRIKYKGKEII